MAGPAGAAHIAPIADLVDHDTSSSEANCVCGPQLRPAAHNDGAVGWLIVHHSLDGREQTRG